VPTSSELLCRNLKQLRERHDFTQEQAALLIGMEYKYYQHIEAGRRSRIRLDTLDKLASAYGLTGSELIAETVPESHLQPPLGLVPRKRRKVK
jgi:transcriptional regulator with XRE-family HTH domain